MIELDEAALAAALRELAIEDEANVDQAVDATAERARGRPALEVEAILCAELQRRGVDLGDQTARLAEQIVQAVN